MKNVNKYKSCYFMPSEDCFEWVKKPQIDKAPMWCSVDLRDGNQSLIIPMSLEEKLEFFKFLVKIGFKEIEVGFPAASETEFLFMRQLIEQDLIPDDVTVQVLTQAREHIIKKTFEAVRGCKNVIIHFYNSTSVAQREQVFKKSKQEIIDIAVSGAKLVKQFSKEYEGNFKFEYSPESFTGTEIDYALEICNCVLDVLQPTPDNKVIINLPVTVSVSMPHVYGCQVEYMCKHLKYRENVIVSIHAHNDRGTAVADSEIALLAGADRIEGTLFGNGERTGNADIVTIAMNMYAQGVDPMLDFSDMKQVVEMFEKINKMTVGQRQPYAGDLVFAAFSGSHQDAIAKGMKFKEDNNSKIWSVPYLPIDPLDVGRKYDSDVIRINSQSGKGGIGYILEQEFGYNLPKNMREMFGYYVKQISDQTHKEIKSDEIFNIFKSDFVNLKSHLTLNNFTFENDNQSNVNITINNTTKDLVGKGNGGLDSVFNAIAKELNITSQDFEYSQHAIEKGSDASAASYVGIKINDTTYYGVGVDKDIMTSSCYALISALNRYLLTK